MTEWARLDSGLAGMTEWARLDSGVGRNWARLDSGAGMTEWARLDSGLRRNDGMGAVLYLSKPTLLCGLTFNCVKSQMKYIPLSGIWGGGPESVQGLDGLPWLYPPRQNGGQYIALYFAIGLTAMIGFWLMASNRGFPAGIRVRFLPKELCDGLA